MTVSIIIAVKTFNDNLKECLEKCCNLDYHDFEIIVFPDERFIFDNPKVRIIETGKISAPKKRDIALKEAKGEILAFIDDDAYPKNRDWLKKAIRHFSDPEIAAVGGPAITPLNDSPRQSASGSCYESILVSGFYSLRYKPKTKCYVEDYPSCNFIIRKSVFQQIGGFNVDFWPGEDTILCLEITKKLNKRILYDPEVIVYHHRRTLFKKHLQQIANYALHRGYFMKKFPQTSRKLSYFLPSLLLSFIFFGAIATFLFPRLNLLYFLGTGAYLLLVLVCSISKDLRLIYLKFFGIILSHMVYGWNLLKGLFSSKLSEEK